MSNAEIPAVVLPAPADSALFLDFDGTLVEIAARPDAIDVPDRVPRLLDRARERTGGRVAIVSGRTIAELRHYLPGFDGPLVGAHGAEHFRAGKTVRAVDIDPETIATLHDTVAAFARRTPGLLAEAKDSGAVLHHREAPEAAEAAGAFMSGLVASLPGFVLQGAHAAHEIRPEGVGKDRALALLCRDEPFAGGTPIFAGDDLTDEPALDWVQQRGGTGLRIGEGETVAAHRLTGPAALLTLLETWLD